MLIFNLINNNYNNMKKIKCAILIKIKQIWLKIINFNTKIIIIIEI